MVTIYSTPTCAYCAQVKKYLEMKNISYTEKSALDSPEYQDLANRYGYSVPLITYKDQGMVGYDLPKLIKMLKA